MAVELKENTNPGELYFGTQLQEVYHLHHFCTKPTATLERIDSDNKVGGAVGSPLLDPFIKLNELNKSKLINIIEKLAENFRHKKVEIEVKLDKIKELEREIVKLKIKKNEDSNNQG